MLTNYSIKQYLHQQGFIRRNGGLTSPRVLANKANRRARLKNAMPPWANKKAIQKVYETATWMSIETGISFHVDHIIPLCGANVSGLHVEWNLQVISAEANMKKGNRMIANTPFFLTKRSSF